MRAQEAFCPSWNLEFRLVSLELDCILESTKNGGKVKVKVAQSCLTLCDPMDYSPWNSPGQNTGVGSLSLLRGIFPTQGLNPGLLHCRWICYHLSHQGGEGDGTPLQYSCLVQSHRRRSLVGCSPWGRKESDTTEQLPFHFLLSCIGEGNGNLLQCSCLENPRDGAAWWAAVYGVT